MREICLKVKPVLQPSPSKNPGGDCFACSFTAILKHLFGDENVDFEKIWHYWETEANNGSIVLNNSWTGFRNTFYNAKDDYPIELANIFILPNFEPEIFPYSFYNNYPYSEWSQRLEAYLSADWIALSVIDFEGRGSVLPGGKLNSNNHFIVIDGIRIEWKQHPTVECSKSLVYSVHVVCSAKGTYWIDSRDLMQNYGAAALWLVRKDII